MSLVRDPKKGRQKREDDPMKAWVKNANKDAPKAKREAKETDMVFIGFRVHQDIDYSLEMHCAEKRLIWSEVLRIVMLKGMEAEKIVIREKPKPTEGLEE